ncbi:MAG: response regulator transcription factor [Myxococcales bacterium]|nr:response regulator transcription factor [Myxococcales bacterium]
MLVVEDDENLRLALVDNLEDEGHQVREAATVAEAEAALAGGAVDLIILDIMLPDGDGYSLCRRYRAGGGAAMVLMLTARSLEEDVVRGFDVGADDYLAKPYRLRELLARVAALLRRAGGRPAGGFGGVRLDRTARVVHDAEGREVVLTRTEFDLLLHFDDHRGQALTRNAILDAVWGEDVVVDERTVDNFVSNLKKKLGWTPDARWRIGTVRGVGYRFEVD